MKKPLTLKPLTFWQTDQTKVAQQNIVQYFAVQHLYDLFAEISVAFCAQEKEQVVGNSKTTQSKRKFKTNKIFEKKNQTRTQLQKKIVSTGIINVKNIFPVQMRKEEGMLEWK